MIHSEAALTSQTLVYPRHAKHTVRRRINLRYPREQTLLASLMTLLQTTPTPRRLRVSVIVRAFERVITVRRITRIFTIALFTMLSVRAVARVLSRAVAARLSVSVVTIIVGRAIMVVLSVRIVARIFGGAVDVMLAVWIITLLRLSMLGLIALRTRFAMGGQERIDEVGVVGDGEFAGVAVVGQVVAAFVDLEIHGL